MAITRPVTKTKISTTDFGIPVVDAVNAIVPLNAQTVAIPTQTVGAGVNGIVWDRTWTVPPNVKALQFVAYIGTTTAAVGDFVAYDIAAAGIANASIAALANISVTCAGISNVSGSSVRLRLNIYAWAGAAITIDGGKSRILVWPVSNRLADAATVWP